MARVYCHLLTLQWKYFDEFTVGCSDIGFTHAVTFISDVWSFRSLFPHVAPPPWRRFIPIPKSIILPIVCPDYFIWSSNAGRKILRCILSRFSRIVRCDISVPSEKVVLFIPPHYLTDDSIDWVLLDAFIGPSARLIRFVVCPFCVWIVILPGVDGSVAKAGFWIHTVNGNRVQDSVVIDFKSNSGTCTTLHGAFAGCTSLWYADISTISVFLCASAVSGHRATKTSSTSKNIGCVLADLFESWL